MKTKLLLCVFSLMTVTLSFSQDIDSVKVIEFDFDAIRKTTYMNKNHSVICKDEIGEGDYYQIVVKGINLNLYKVSLSAKDTVLSSPQHTPTFADVNFDELNKIIAGITAGNITINETTDILNSILNKAQNHKGFTDPKEDKLKKLNDTMDIEIDNVRAYKLKAEAIAKKLDDLKMNLYKVRLASQRENISDLNYNYTQALIDIEEIRKEISKARESVVTSLNKYNDWAKKHKTDIDGNTVLKAKDKDVNASYAELEKILSTTAEIISADKAFELLSSLVYLEDNIGENFVSVPQQFRGEQAKITLSIVPRDEKLMKQSYSTTLVFPYKIQTYTNIGISFYGATLHDQTYTLTKIALTDSTANYTVTEGDYDKVELGLSALLRYGKKWNDSNCFGGHLSFGAGMSIANKIKPRLMLGGGVSIGRKHMFALDIGAIAGYRDRIHKDITLDSPYNEEPTQILVSKLGIGVFGAIGYIYQF